MNTTLKLIQSNIESQFNPNYLTAPVVLMGPPGVGKTSTVRQITKDKNYNLINISAASLSLEQASGIPDFKIDNSMDKYSSVGTTESKVTEWSVPEVIYQANYITEQTERPTIILLDDLHRMPQATKSALYELLLERQLKQYKLNDNVAVVATSNDSDEAGFEGMDSPIINRLAFLNFNPSHEYWMQTSGRFYHHFISSFLKSNPQYLNEQESVTDPFGTARSWEALSNQFKVLDDEKFIIGNINIIAKQYVSKEAVNELTRHVQYVSKIDFSKIVKQKEIIDIEDLNILDQILYQYIFNYIIDVDDVQYLVNLIEENKSEESFVGFLMANIYTKYQAIEKGDSITLGQEAFLSKFIEQPMKSKLKKKDQEIFDSIEIKDKDTLLKLSFEYLTN